MHIKHNLLPHWVTPPPTGEGIVDALGLSTILDACADNILPGISVLTTRARYWSFFCWARANTVKNITEEIHQWEVSLSRGEHSIHSGAKTECSWLGKRIDPGKVTRNPGWLAYRPALVAAQLVEHIPPYQLTEDGKRLSRLYKNAARPPKHRDGKWRDGACLTAINGDEKNALRGIIGISNRGHWICQSENSWAKRWATSQNLKPWAGTSDAGVILLYWRDRRRGFNENGRWLAQAGGWVSLAFGMTALLVAWIDSIDLHSDLVKAIKSERRKRHTIQKVSIINRNNLQNPMSIRSALSAVFCGVDALESLGCGVEHPVRTWGKDLTSSQDPGAILEHLKDRHEKLKGPLAWTLLENRVTIPKQIQMSNLRIGAMLSLGKDLGWRPK